jgi:hypothetical protein
MGLYLLFINFCEIFSPRNDHCLIIAAALPTKMPWIKEFEGLLEAKPQQDLVQGFDPRYSSALRIILD